MTLKHIISHYSSKAVALFHSNTIILRISTYLICYWIVSINTTRTPINCFMSIAGTVWNCITLFNSKGISSIISWYIISWLTGNTVSIIFYCSYINYNHTTIGWKTTCIRIGQNISCCWLSSCNNFSFIPTLNLIWASRLISSC